jgi:hypothetical protein
MLWLAEAEGIRSGKVTIPKLRGKSRLGITEKRREVDGF